MDFEFSHSTTYFIYSTIIKGPFKEIFHIFNNQIWIQSQYKWRKNWYTKVLFIFRCSKNWQKKSVHHHLLTNHGAHLFLPIFTAAKDEKYFRNVTFKLNHFTADLLMIGMFFLFIFSWFFFTFLISISKDSIVTQNWSI